MGWHSPLKKMRPLGHIADLLYYMMPQALWRLGRNEIGGKNFAAQIPITGAKRTTETPGTLRKLAKGKTWLTRQAVRAAAPVPVI